MILLLDTTTPTCRLTIIDDDQVAHDYTWQAERDLARGLLEFVVTTLAAHQATFDQVTGLGIRRGPGSFTGLRIGAATWNTVADARAIPLVGTTGEAWQAEARARLAAGDNDQIVLPEYGRSARITSPRK